MSFAYGFLQIALESAPENRFILEIARIETVLAATSIFGCVESQVSRMNDFFARHAIMRSDRYPDRRPDHATSFFERIGLREHFDDPRGDIAEFTAIILVLDHDLKFITAQAPNFTVIAYRAPQARGDLLEQFVTCCVAQCVIDLFEAVQVQHHYRAIPLGRFEGCQGTFNQLRHPVAIGKAGQGVKLGEALCFFLAMKIFGDVSTGSTKTQERPATSKVRASRQTDDDTLVASLGAYFKSREGFTSAQF